MKVIEPGHMYDLDCLDGDGSGEQQIQRLIFVNREDNHNHYGTQNQEVLRALIDRMHHLDKQKPWDGNAKIIYYLRLALILHEQRVMEVKFEDDKLPNPEDIPVGTDGHFIIQKD